MKGVWSHLWILWQRYSREEFLLVRSLWVAWEVLSPLAGTLLIT